jgi:hypothetical protein
MSLMLKKEVILLFLNTRSEPLKIKQLKALKRRMKPQHPARYLIEQDLNKRSAGYWGEMEVDKKLLRIDQEKYYIISDLRLPNGDGTYFQIDTLVLSTSFFLIIDSKNIAGTLYFDLINHQFYRIISDGKTESFSDPVSQVRLHQQQLFQWLKRNKFPTSPIDFLVTLTNPHSIFKILHPEHPYAPKICMIAGLTWKIDDLANIYKKKIITANDVRKIGEALLKANTPPKPSEILHQYGISKNELLTGVHCPECEYLPLIYRVGKWGCPRCRKSFKDAHILAVEDYFLLIKPSITNSEFRKFLHMHSPDTATVILKQLDLQVSSGKTRGRTYQKRDSTIEIV